jgi:hypothetical protein
MDVIELTPEEANARLLAGTFPTRADGVAVVIEGSVGFIDEPSITHIQSDMVLFYSLDLIRCTNLTHLPRDLKVISLNVTGCTSLKTLPTFDNPFSGIDADESGLETLPGGLRVSYHFSLVNCKALREIGPGSHFGFLRIDGCTALKALPEDLSIHFLSARGCTSLERWGERGKVTIGKITLSGCTGLTYLPDWLTPLDTLDVSGCTRLTRLPNDLVVNTSIALADSGLTELPPGCKGAKLRWHDVEIDERIAFHPETITAQEIISEPNVELRRVMMERMGYEAFLQQANPEERDRDFDAGGLRRLLKIEFPVVQRQPADEPLVCLSVICPSTARQYIIRVPPTMQTCHQAAAWIAGFDDAGQYHPIRET